MTMAPHESLAKKLVERQKTIVFAESCTGGLIAALLARIPGISGVLAGSFVVYQVASKQQWLSIAPEIFR